MKNQPSAFRRFIIPGYAAALCFLLFGGGGLASQTGDAAYWYGEGLSAMVREDWYAAVEDFLECLRANPARGDAAAALAECYYTLGEFDESLSWVRKARTLARNNLDLANLEASIQIALGRGAEASRIIAEVLSREPYNREALFTAAELDISRGRSGDAVIRFREAVKRYPDDRRLFISLALTLSSLGEKENARLYIDKALSAHPGDGQVRYFAAYLYSQAGRLYDAIGFAEQALVLKPGYLPALSLLATLRYEEGSYEESARLADILINRNREDSRPWYLKGMSLARVGRIDEAIAVLSQGAVIDGEDEFIRAALEELLCAHTPLESPERGRWAEAHFNKAREFRGASLSGQALFEYRRGLRLNPYAADRREFAELLRLQGYPARYLEELRFLQEQGMGDRSLEDAVESYTALLGDALARRWGVNPVLVSRPHWKVAVFALVPGGAGAGFAHVDAGAAAAAYLGDIMVHERNIQPLDIPLRQESFSAAFRAARDGGADYFLLVSVSESDRDLSLRGELFAARTGGRAAEFAAYRAGKDRLRYAARSLTEQLKTALPFRAELLERRQSAGLIDKGWADGVAKGDVYQVIRKHSAATRNEGLGLVYGPSDLLGTITITEAGEEVSAGTIVKQGFFDRVSAGDEIILAEEKGPGGEGSAGGGGGAGAAAGTEPPQADPELRALLRSLKAGW